MRRRELLMLLLGGAMTAPRTLHAQQKAEPVIGYLGSTSPGPNALFVAAFRRGLSEAGYIEGQNVAIEYRWAEGRFERLPALAADLVNRKVDMIVTGGGPSSALAAKHATSTIPILFTAVGNPVAAGLVDSLARPGGNVTGLSVLVAELNPKRFQLLSELVPQAGVIALLVNPNNASAERVMRDVQEAAHAKGVRLHILKAGTVKPRSMPPSTPSGNCRPVRSSSATIRSSTTGASSSSRWQRAMPFRPSMSGLNLLRSAA